MISNSALYVMSGDYVLVCRRGVPGKYYGLLYTAGGMIDGPGESPKFAAARESYEESGFRPDPEKLTLVPINGCKSVAIYVINCSSRPKIPGPIPECAGEIINSQVIPGIPNNAGGGWTWMKLDDAIQLSYSEAPHGLITRILTILRNPSCRGPVVHFSTPSHSNSHSPLSPLPLSHSTSITIPQNLMSIPCRFNCHGCRGTNNPHYCFKCSGKNHHRSSTCYSRGASHPCVFNCGKCIGRNPHRCRHCGAYNHHRSDDCEKTMQK
jgi:8-oxo-dGTP pyrophosphatase MutT (NUDIX family)